METYSYYSGRVNPGIKLEKDERLGYAVFLGEAGRGRRLIKVGLDRYDPACFEKCEGGTALVFRCGVKKIKTKTGFELFRLTREKRSEPNRVLVRIDTSGEYTRDSWGRTEPIAGDPHEIVYGYGAHGLAGRCGGWKDYLTILQRGDAVKIITEGGSKTENYVLEYDEYGKLSVVRIEEWEGTETEEETL